MQIFIPTRNRVFQETFTSLPPDIRERVHFVVPHDDKNIVGAYVMKTPPEIDGIGPTRQWILDNSTDKKVLMLDDDLVFATRRTDAPTKFRASSHEDVRFLFNSIDAHLDKFAHVGVSTREGGNRDTSDVVFSTRLLRVLAYRADVLHEQAIRFDRMELMEDFDATLQLLRAGYPNIKINWIVHNQRSSNAPGGCSTYRTLAKQSEAARRLRDYHPQFVSVVTKKTKTAWNGQERQDVVIAWKRAIESARKIIILDSGTQPSDAQEGSGPTEAVE